jgi:hypothetical protein
VLELRRVGNAGEQCKRFLNDRVEFFHALSEKKGGSTSLLLIAELT